MLLLKLHTKVVETFHYSKLLSFNLYFKLILPMPEISFSRIPFNNSLLLRSVPQAMQLMDQTGSGVNMSFLLACSVFRATVS